MSVSKDFFEIIKKGEAKKTKAYDTQATVVRVEGSTIWVHIPGGVDETPVQRTINAKVGDTVQVRVGGGSAWLVGNQTAPPTDDTETLIVKNEVKAVKKNVDAVKVIAGNTNQYFWHTESGTDTGAHITEIPKEQFLTNPNIGGGNLLARSNGIAVRDGLTELAIFGANVARVGEDGSCIYIYSNSLQGQSDNIDVFKMSLNGSTTQTRKKTILGEYPANQYQTVTFLLSDNSAWSEVSSGETFYISKRSPSDTSWYIDSFRRGTASVGTYTNVIYDGNSTITFDTYHYTQMIVEMEYFTQTNAPTYIFGTTHDNTTIGAYAFSAGYDNMIEGDYSHAEGNYTSAHGESSHAEGEATEANGKWSHVEGFFSKANASYSHAQNHNTIASSDSQTALGKYNIEDTQGTYAVIVGNGSSHNNRSNALTVAWNGNTVIAGTLTQNSDKRLKKHIDYLGDDADEFIRNLKPAHFTKDGEDHVGFYAQDVAEIDAWGCMTGEMNSYMTLGYAEIIAPLVAYCQSLEKRICELEKEKL